MDKEIILLGLNGELKNVVQAVLENKRLSIDQALTLYKSADLGLLGVLADRKKKQLHGDKIFYIKNTHLELTNRCVFNCNFCSYKLSSKHEGWKMSDVDVIAHLEKQSNKDIVEIHLTSGVHPAWDMSFYANIIHKVRAHLPAIHIKAFSAVELDYMFRKSGVTFKEGFAALKEAGLNSIPGGGAEIFDPGVRKEICPDKVDATGWLAIHKAAHESGIASNATMLYGHIETYEHRLDHMGKLRDLQDQTGGFNAFIPLKFKNKNNRMSHLKEGSLPEDLRNYAVARLFMDNFDHIKAYWPMLGKGNSQLTLSFGVDDMDGTIDDSTKIYSMAGAEDQSPVMSSIEMQALIKQVNGIPVERDSLYNEMISA